MSSIRIRWSLYQYEAATLPHSATLICSWYGGKIRSRVFPKHETDQARQWLGDMGLDARQARRLLDAALRGIGPFARIDHPRRVASGPEAATAATQQGPAAAFPVSAAQSGGNGAEANVGHFMTVRVYS